jgi:hypothetical protein
MFKKLIAKLFKIKTCACGVCLHLNSTVKKVKYCLDCKKIIQEY